MLLAEVHSEVHTIPIHTQLNLTINMHLVSFLQTHGCEFRGFQTIKPCKTITDFLLTKKRTNRKYNFFQ